MRLHIIATPSQLSSKTPHTLIAGVSGFGKGMFGEHYVTKYTQIGWKVFDINSESRGEGMFYSIPQDDAGMLSSIDALTGGALKPQSYPNEIIMFLGNNIKKLKQLPANIKVCVFNEEWISNEDLKSFVAFNEQQVGLMDTIFEIHNDKHITLSKLYEFLMKAANPTSKERRMLKDMGSHYATASTIKRRARSLLRSGLFYSNPKEVSPFDDSLYTRARVTSDSVYTDTDNIYNNKTSTSTTSTGTSTGIVDKRSGTRSNRSDDYTRSDDYPNELDKSTCLDMSRRGCKGRFYYLDLEKSARDVHTITTFSTYLIDDVYIRYVCVNVLMKKFIEFIEMRESEIPLLFYIREMNDFYYMRNPPQYVTDIQTNIDKILRKGRFLGKTKIMLVADTQLIGDLPGHVFSGFNKLVVFRLPLADSKQLLSKATIPPKYLQNLSQLEVGYCMYVVNGGFEYPVRVPAVLHKKSEPDFDVFDHLAGIHGTADYASTAFCSSTPT